MKIIATVARCKYLVEVDGKELANICGKTWEHEVQPEFHVGMEVKVSALWTALQTVLRQEATLKVAAQGLRDRAADIDTVIGTIQFPVVVPS